MPSTGDTLEALQTEIGVTFQDSRLLRQALVHRSYLYEHPDPDIESNERLEFLGDAVISYVCTLYLYRQFPGLQEGELTALRSAAVRADTLAKFASAIDLGRYLLLGRGEQKSGGGTRPLLLSSAFEALVGAMLLDRGLDTVTTFLDRFLIPELELIVAEGRQENYKSLLQESTQGNLQTTPIYRTARTSGPSHARTFEVEVLVNDKVAGQGAGPSKRAAQQAAAKAALEELREEGGN
ncbi:MAG TPA: ribonuclease III [Chloroflexota bacterium]|nr:ribonuclease III [Chloroflexota bacterium]